MAEPNLTPHSDAVDTRTARSPGSLALRRTTLESMLGLAAGVVLAGLFGPRMISFWYEPPSKDAFSCASSVEQALLSFLKLQLAFAVAGALCVCVLSFFVRRFFRRRRERSAELARPGTRE